MAPEDWFEECRRRAAEAAQRRRDRLVRAAAQRAEARKRHAGTKAAAVARMTEIHDRHHQLLGTALARMFQAMRLRQAGRPVPDIKPGRRRRRRPDVEDGGVPVTPDRPRNLSGGAAAALDFENE